MTTDKWVKRWEIGKSNGDGFWVVAIDKNGNYGCSCPCWKFRREECKHIQYVKANPRLKPNIKTIVKQPDLIPAKVLRPIFNKRKNTIFYPLVPIPRPVWMEATICYFLMEHGFSWAEVKEKRSEPNEWTKQAVYAYIAKHGLAQYKSYNWQDNNLIRQAS